MKIGFLISAAVGAAAFSTAALAVPPAGSVTGEVDVTGVVTGSCSVITDGGTSQTFTRNINLGELDQANGRLNTSLTGGPVTVSVVCNTSAPSIAMSATSLVGSTAPPDSTYTNVVGYTAHLTVTETSGSESFSAISAVSTPPVTSATLAHQLAGTSNNVNVSVDTLTSNGGILTSGTYGTPGGGGGVIAITISPV